MQYNLQNNSVNINYSLEVNTASEILDLMKLQNNNLTASIENGEKFICARNKLLKQLPNIYKNTRLSKFTIEEAPVMVTMQYKRIKGLVLNVQKRMCWYLNIDPETTKCLLISIKAKTFKEDLEPEDRAKYYFVYYCKFIFPSSEGYKFVAIPLINLNINVI